MRVVALSCVVVATFLLSAKCFGDTPLTSTDTVQAAEKAILACQKQGIETAKELFANDTAGKEILNRYAESSDHRLRYISFSALEIYVREKLLNHPESLPDKTKVKALMDAFECHDKAEARHRDLTDENG